jgi:HD-like signal output (HDOD) protein
VLTRILFVDDEPRVLDGLRRTLRPHRERWDMSFATGGRAALDELSRNAFDVLVTDMRMPDVDGLALLTAARDQWPGMVRIVLSGYMDMEAAIRSTSVAHQFLAKPCDPAELEDVIARTRRLTGLLADETLRTAVGEIGHLAASPAVYTRLERVIADPSAGTAEVATVIEHDVSLTAKMLQLVNSSFFGLPRRVNTVEHAVAFLGSNVIRALVLSHELAVLADARPLAPGFSIADHQLHSLRVAGLARRIVGRGPMADDAFLAGVLHDVGELVLAAQRPEWFRAHRARSAERGILPHDAEVELYGVSHAEVGAYLVGLWGLPFGIVEAIAHHHVPGRAGERPALDVLAAVHIAECLIDQTSEGAGMAARLDGALVERLGMARRLEEWSGFAREMHEGDRAIA